MPQTKQFNPAVLLVVVPVLAACVLVYQRQSRQEVSSQTHSAAVSSTPALAYSTLPGSRFSAFKWKPTLAEKLVLKLKNTKPKTMPTSVSAYGSALAAANTVYFLTNQFDVNGFAYYQSRDKSQYCQWSTLNLCWCIRNSLVVDSPDARPSAEYCSRGRQAYATGPAGPYWFGGMCPMVTGSAPITVITPTALSKH